MMTEKIKTFVLDHIQRAYTLPEDMDPMQLDYVSGGYVNSMEMILFITSIEDEFDIVFSDDDMAGDAIRVVGSLIALIEQKLREKQG